MLNPYGKLMITAIVELSSHSMDLETKPLRKINDYRDRVYRIKLK